MFYDITCSIVLFHNPAAELKAVIDSFLAYEGKKKLLLVDNSANDSLRFEFEHPDIHYLFVGKNLGYGTAHNVALAKVKGLSKYHIILNPDVEFEPESLRKLFAFMEARQDVGLVMPKVLYKNGEMQYLCKKLPSPTDLFLRRFIPGPVKAVFKKRLDTYELKHKDYNSIMEIPNLSGCFMFVRNEVLQTIGGFDERYFLYLEDTDFCRRINEHFRTVYYPLVTVVHGYSKASYKSAKLMKYHILSSIKYFNKWGWLFDTKRLVINRDLLSRKFEAGTYVPKPSPFTQEKLHPTPKLRTHGALLQQ